MSQTIKCPKCDAKGWSSDYWTCPSCGYYETKEETLLEMNKDFEEGRNKGDEPSIRLNDWMKDKEDLTREMVNECLPKGKYNWELDFNRTFPEEIYGGRVWGITEYHENNFTEADLFINRHAEKLIEEGSKRDGFIYYVNMRGEIVKMEPKEYPIYPNYSNLGRNWGTPCCPCAKRTKILIPQQTLQTEGDYYFDGDGYFPTIPHEMAHADPSVHRHPNYQPFASLYSYGPGHDDIHWSKNWEFYHKLESKYKEKVKSRFKELRRIKGKDDDKYS